MGTNLHQAETFIDLVGLNDTWPDLDMIPFGDVGCDRDGDHCNGGHAHPEEVEYFMTVYMMSRSPLLFGGKLPDTTKFVDLYIKPKALAVNANSTNTRVINSTVATNFTFSIWAADMPLCPALDTSKTCLVVAGFNLGSGDPQHFHFLLNSTVSQLYHIWNDTTTAFPSRNTVEFDVPLHSAAFFFAQ